MRWEMEGEEQLDKAAASDHRMDRVKRRTWAQPPSAGERVWSRGHRQHQLSHTTLLSSGKGPCLTGFPWDADLQA